jgi:hypothetical protein
MVRFSPKESLIWVSGINSGEEEEEEEAEEERRVEEEDWSLAKLSFFSWRGGERIRLLSGLWVRTGAS